MPIDYSKSKIYQIIPSCDHDEGDIYIGSTVRPLSERMNKHRNDLRCSSKIIFEKYGVNNCKIELIELFPCETKEELLKREGEVQRANKCVNIRIAGRTAKEYRADNRDTILEKKKVYCEEHKDEIKIKNNEYYKVNKEHINEHKKEYQLQNKVQIAEYKKQYQIDNKKALTEQRKQYRMEHIEKFKQKDKKYCELNKDKIKERKRLYYLKKKASLLII